MGVLTRWIDPANWVRAFLPTRKSWIDGPSGYYAPDAAFWYSSIGLPNLEGAIGGANSWAFVSASYAASRLLCGIGATMPENLKQYTEIDGNVEFRTLRSHVAHQLMNVRPNTYQTANVFRSQLVNWQVNWGTAFAEIQRLVPRNGWGQPYRLWPIHPSRTRPFLNAEDGTLWWHVQNKQIDGTSLPPTDIPDVDMIRIPYMVIDDDGLHGVGVAKMASRSIGLAQTLERTEADASSTSIPRIAVEHPNKMAMPEQDAFRRQWSELFSQGSDNVPALLVGGAKIKTLDWSAVDTDHRARREYIIEEIARWYDVPLTLLRRAMTTAAGNVEQLGNEFQTFSLKFLELWEQECSSKLLSEEERAAGMIFENDYRSLLKADHAGRADYWQKRFSMGTATPNQIKAAEGENPSKTENADMEFVQGAMRPLKDPYKQGAENPVQQPQDGKRDALAPAREAKALRISRAAIRGCIRSTLSRMATKETKRIQSEAANARTFIPKMEKFYKYHEPQLVEALESLCAPAREIGLAVNERSLAAEWCEESMGMLLKASETPASKLIESVKLCLEDWPLRGVTACEGIGEVEE